MAYFPNGTAGLPFDCGNKIATAILKMLVKDNGTCNMKAMMEEYENKDKIRKVIIKKPHKLTCDV